MAVNMMMMMNMNNSIAINKDNSDMNMNNSMAINKDNSESKRYTN